MSKNRRPRYVLFAGVNGAGKSTLFRSGLWLADEGDVELPRINSDEILVERGWDWADSSAQLRAGREAVRMMRTFMGERASFNQETTLAGRSIVREVKKAIDLGYEVVVHYVGVESPDIAIERITHRVTTGGHGIAPEDVSRRYASSLDNLAPVICLADRVFIFDNTHELASVAAFSKGELAWVTVFPRVEWLHRALDGTGLFNGSDAQS